MEDAVAVAVSADVPDARDTPNARDTPDDDKRDDTCDDTCDDKKSGDNNDEGDGYAHNPLSHVDDVVGPEYRRQITNTGKWK